MKLETGEFPIVKVGDIVFTMEARACFDEGMCGESLTQKTRYEVIIHNEHLMAKCLDYDSIKELRNLRSFGQAWTQDGYEKDTGEQND